MSTSITTVPEHLLTLAGGFVRSREAHRGIELYPNTATAQRLAGLTSTTRTLARATLDLSNTLAGPQLHRDPQIQTAIVRSVQLASLTNLAADHIGEAADLLQSALRIDGGPGLTRRDALAAAGERVASAEHLTCLGAQDCLTSARSAAQALRRQGFAPVEQGPSLTAAQRACLESVAAGRVRIHRHVDKPFSSRQDQRVSIITVRSLERRGLVTRWPTHLSDDVVILSADGCRSLAALLGRLPAGAPSGARPLPARNLAAAPRPSARR